MVGGNERQDGLKYKRNVTIGSGELENAMIGVQYVVNIKIVTIRARTRISPKDVHATSSWTDESGKAFRLVVMSFDTPD